MKINLLNSKQTSVHKLQATSCVLLFTFLLVACTAGPLPAGARARLGMGIIYSIALSPDGDDLAVSTNLGLHLYRADTFQEVWFKPVAGGTVDVTFSPDGTRLASLSQDGVILWDIERGKPLRTLARTRDPVGLLAFSPDGTLLALRDDLDIVSVWNTRTGKMLHTLELEVELVVPPDLTRAMELKYREVHGVWFYPPPIWGAAWSPDGAALASGIHYGKVVVWDVETGKPLHELEGPGSWPPTLAFSPDGATLASRLDEGVVILWNMATGERLRTLEGQRGSGGGLAWSPDGTTLASGWGEGTVVLWDVATGEAVRTMAGLTTRGTTFYSADEGETFRATYCGVASGLAFSPDGATLISGSDTEVVAWDVATGESLRILVGVGMTYHLAFSPDGTRLVSGGQDGIITVWDTETNEPLCRLSGHTDDIFDMAFSPDGAVFASGADDDQVILWDTKTWEPLHTLQVHTHYMESIAFSPDGVKFASSSYDYTSQEYTVIVWEMETGERLWALKDSTGGDSLSWSPDGETLAGTGDDTVTVWDAETGERLRTLQHTDYVWDVAWSPDGTMLAGTSSGTMIVWEMETGRQLRTFEYEGTWVAWSPDWSRFASGGQDGLVILWDMETGERLRKLEGHIDVVHGMAFSPDGTTLATGSSDGTVILWDVP